MLESSLQTHQDFVRTFMLSNGFLSPTFLGNLCQTSGLLPSEGPLHCARTPSIKLSNTLETCKDIYAFDWFSLTIFCRKFRPSFSVVRLLPPQAPFRCARTSSTQTHQKFVRSFTFDWLSLTIFCRKFRPSFSVLRSLTSECQGFT